MTPLVSHAADPVEPGDGHRRENDRDPSRPGEGTRDEIAVTVAAVPTVPGFRLSRLVRRVLYTSPVTT